MRFPVRKLETQHGVDYRIAGAFSPQSRSGSVLVGYITANSKTEAVRRLKSLLTHSLRGAVNR